MHKLAHNENGSIPILAIIAVVGIASFLVIATIAPFRSKTLTTLYPKEHSHASALLPSDLNDDGIVNALDFALLLAKWGTTDPVADLNKDGTVGLVDFSILLSKWGSTPPSPTPSSSPTANWHPCGVSPDEWHPPVVNGCQVGHEHGDQPPDWVQNSSWPLKFSGAFNTHPTVENGQGPDDTQPALYGKHNAMKNFGFTGTNGVDYFARYHSATNVLDRQSQFHSFEFWSREPNGKVSHISGWTNSGIPSRMGDGTAGAGGRRNNCSPEIDIRPEGQVSFDLNCNKNQQPNELWYFYPMAAWHPTLVALINQTTLAYVGEYNELSMVNWRRTGSMGDIRETAVHWNPKGVAGDPLKTPPFDKKFWATQFGELVSGPNDPRCSQTTTFKANPTAGIHPFDVDTTHQNICLEQFVSSTAIQAADQRNPKWDYRAPGLRLPN